MRVLFALIAALILSSPAMAGDLTISVRDSADRPVQDAVVTVHPAAGAPRGPIRFAWPLRMAQQDIQFQPYVLIVPVGGTVSFPNLDRVRHQVYSFSRGNRFELQLYGRDESRTHTFSAAGVAALGCNIHDQMLAYIKVVDTPCQRRRRQVATWFCAAFPRAAPRFVSGIPASPVAAMKSPAP